MFKNTNPYHNVVSFPSGKPCVANEYAILQKNVRDLNSYLEHVEKMVKNFKWKKPVANKLQDTDGNTK